MLARTVSNVTCTVCNSVTPYDMYCRWCSKPIVSYVARAPTAEESFRYSTKQHRGTFKRRNGPSHPISIVDDATRELYMEIQGFCRKHVMAETAFGRKVHGDASIVARIKQGTKFRQQTIDDVRRAMDRYEG